MSMRIPQCLLIVLVVGTVSANPNNFLISWTKHSVSLIDSESGNVETVFLDSMINLNNYRHSKVRLSQSGKYVSISGLKRPEKRFINGEVVSDTHVLTIIDLKNKTSRSIENVRDASWAPSGDSVVYVLGENYDNSSDYFVGKYAVLFDCLADIEKDIFTKESSIFGIHWAEYNGKIYCYANGVKEYDPGSMTETKTRFKHCDLSPDGRYYYLPPIEGEEAVLFNAFDNSKITVTTSEQDALRFGLHVQLIEWAVVDQVTYAYVANSYELFRIDCSTGKMIGIVPPSPEIEPIDDLVGFRDGSPVWAKVRGEKAELFYY